MASDPPRAPHVLILTGGMGAGKSTAARAFSALGITVIDADALAHAVTGPGGPAVAALRAAFGAALVSEAGGLDRAAGFGAGRDGDGHVRVFFGDVAGRGGVWLVDARWGRMKVMVVGSVIEGEIYIYIYNCRNCLIDVQSKAKNVERPPKVLEAPSCWMDAPRPLDSSRLGQQFLSCPHAYQRFRLNQKQSISSAIKVCWSVQAAG